MKKQKKKDLGTIQNWGKIPTIASHSDLSPRYIRNLIKAGELRYSKLSTGTILIKFAWIDEYLENREVKDTVSKMDRIIGDVLANFEKQ
ncbi:MAG: hypothetical protein GX642_14350 [Smithella sp.]|nr:hypothetical protein [Smithella sp.]